MKYRRLTSEQLNEMHNEFAKFLATQKIDADKWQEIKDTNPELVQEQLDLFSDLVWEKVLNNTKYIDHIEAKQLDLFRANPETINRIVIKSDKPDFDFRKKEDYQWFIDHSTDKSFTYLKGEKPYTKDRNAELFDMLLKGSYISDGKLFESVTKIIG